MSEHSNDTGDKNSKPSDNAASQKIADALLVISLLSIAALYVVSRQGGESSMPDKVVDEAEINLYLTAGGAYTVEDIIANGKRTASQRFKTFNAKHDFKPKVGDMVCPITRTKANPLCSWVIGGKEYYFCCPPCIDEFLATAKSDADTIQDPGDYVLR